MVNLKNCSYLENYWRLSKIEFIFGAYVFLKFSRLSSKYLIQKIIFRIPRCNWDLYFCLWRLCFFEVFVAEIQFLDQNCFYFLSHFLYGISVFNLRNNADFNGNFKTWEKGEFKELLISQKPLVKKPNKGNLWRLCFFEVFAAAIQIFDQKNISFSNSAIELRFLLVFSKIP